MNFSEMERGLEATLKANLNTRATPIAAPAGPFDRAHAAMETARCVALRIGVLRERLLGPAPESAGSGGSISGDGVFNELEHSADRTLEALADAAAALTAIERNLP